MSIFLNRCNGINSPRLRFSEAAFQVFCANIGQARAAFRKLADEHRVGYNDFTFEGRDYYLGRRFLDDESVIPRIESAMKDEGEFLAAPYAWCLDALASAARSDHWYAFEKEY